MRLRLAVVSLKSEQTEVKTQCFPSYIQPYTTTYIKMPSSWERIPKELLEAILDSIEEHEFFTTRIRKKCLFQVMLTCKHWSSIAKDVFYNEQFKINMDTAKNLIADKTTRQLALKNIQVTYELANDAAFIKLLSMCPDLRSLRVEERSYRVAEASNAQKSFYTSLYTLSRSNHLAKLQRVNFPLNRAHADHLLAHHQQAML